MSDRRYRNHHGSRQTRETREIAEPQHRETRPRERGSQDSQAQSPPRSDSATRIRSPRSSRTDVHHQTQPPVAFSPPHEYVIPNDPPTRHGSQQASGARNVPATATVVIPNDPPTRHGSQQASGARNVPATATVTHGSQGISSASAPPNPLSDLARAFVRISMKKYGECNDFLRSNPELQMEPREQFQRAAMSAIKRSEREYACRCIQAFVLLRGVNLHGRSSYFRNLDEFREERDAVTDDIWKTYDALTRQAQTQPVRPDSTSRAGPQPTQAVYPRRRSGSDLDDLEADMNAVTISSGLDDIPEGSDFEPTADSKATQQKRRTSVHKDPKQDPRYKIYHSKFFCPGRVFATVWASAEGQADSRASDWSRYEGGLHVTTRRMVVVRSRRGSSQCLAVTTYAGRGLSKQGLNDEDVNAHAIIYADQHAPKYLTNEPRTRKNSIAVAVVQGQKLGIDSRVCFSKIHTVEHNVKVMDVGQVIPDCMGDLLKYFKAENQF